MHTIIPFDLAVIKLDFCCQAHDGDSTVKRDDVMPQDLVKPVWLIEYQVENEAPYLESISTSRMAAIDKACANTLTYTDKRAPNGFREGLERGGVTTAIFKGSRPTTTRLIQASLAQAINWPSATWNNPPPPDEFLI